MQAEQRENRASGSLVSGLLTLSYTVGLEPMEPLFLNLSLPSRVFYRLVPPHLDKAADFNSFK